MARTPDSTPENQFPQQALKRSVQEFPEPAETGGGYTFTFQLASAADKITLWGKNVPRRDKELRDFWPTEDFLAGAVTNIGMMHAALEWEITGPSERVNQATTDILRAAIGGGTFGWVQFMLLFSQDMSTQDNGGFIELIRDEGMDANSRFKGPLAPVLGIGHLDSNRCVRTGNPEYPVVYTDRKSERHKLKWYEVMALSDQPSSIETMNGVGYCPVTRVLRRAQISRATALYMDEKISGRHYKSIHFVSGVSRQDIKDEMKRGQEEANNTGLLAFINPSILASLDPEKPVSTATIDLAGLPDGFNYDEDMRWYITCLALGFAVDYQEFAPLASGNIGSSAQSMILHRKGTGKGPAVFMRMLSEGFKNYGVLPRGTDMRFNDKDEQEELERADVRKAAMEENAMAINTHALTPRAAAKDMVARGLWKQDIVNEVPEEFWTMFEKNPSNGKQPVGDKGGTTIAEDARRVDASKQNLTAGARLRKLFGGK